MIIFVTRATVSEESEKGKVFVDANNRKPIAANITPAQQ